MLKWLKVYLDSCDIADENDIMQLWLGGRQTLNCV